MPANSRARQPNASCENKTLWTGLLDGEAPLSPHSTARTGVGLDRPAPPPDAGARRPPHRCAGRSDARDLRPGALGGARRAALPACLDPRRRSSRACTTATTARSSPHRRRDADPAVWAITSVAGLALFLRISRTGPLDAATVIRAFLVAFVAPCLPLRRPCVWRRSPRRSGSSWSARTRPVRSGESSSSSPTSTHRVAITATTVGRLAQRPRSAPSASTGSWSRRTRSRSDLIAELVAVCRREHVKLSVVPPARGSFGTAVQLLHVADLRWSSTTRGTSRARRSLLKRRLDVAIAVVMLRPTAPSSSRSSPRTGSSGRAPAFFVQTRAGLGGRGVPDVQVPHDGADAEAMLPGLVRFDELDEPVFKLLRDPR